VRTPSIDARGFVPLAGLVFLTACLSTSSSQAPTCTNGHQDGDETGIDCGGSCARSCTSDPTDPGGGPPSSDGGGDRDGGATATPASSTDGIQNGSETDVDCGGPDAPRCAEGKKCAADSDCNGACGYAKTCVDAPSCKVHLGGDTCGRGEVGQPGVEHESCCRSLPVPGYADPAHPGKTVYLDKYEITTGRVRAFIESIAADYGGIPNIRDWIAKHPPSVWDPSWSRFLPTDRDGEAITIDRRLLGDPRGGPDAPPIPPTDEPRKTGVDFQFNGALFVYLHGNNCSTHAPSAFGFPTFFYPADVLAKMGDAYPPRADGTTLAGMLVPASEHLEVKSMNCISNAMLQAFCHWDGGQLATDAVLDFVTDSPPTLGDKPGCGMQVGTEDPPTTPASMTGGRCADLSKINATYDAGASLPQPNHPLNANNYAFPFFPQGTMHDKAWQIAAPGRGSLAANGEQVDMVRIQPGDEPWMDLAGNLNEVVLKTTGGAFTGKFGLKFRGIGYNSARSELNYREDWEGEGGIRRIERPEARAGFAGGRCMRFK